MTRAAILQIIDAYAATNGRSFYRFEMTDKVSVIGRRIQRSCERAIPILEALDEIEEKREVDELIGIWREIVASTEKANAIAGSGFPVFPYARTRIHIRALAEHAPAFSAQSLALALLDRYENSCVDPSRDITQDWYIYAETLAELVSGYNYDFETDIKIEDVQKLMVLK